MGVVILWLEYCVPITHIYVVLHLIKVPTGLKYKLGFRYFRSAVLKYRLGIYLYFRISGFGTLGRVCTLGFGT